VPTLIFVLKKEFKGDKSIKITANNPNNLKLQQLPHITNNQITQKSPNNTRKRPNNILKSPKMKLQQQISPNQSALLLLLLFFFLKNLTLIPLLATCPIAHLPITMRE
jgi:hypothetical protein